MTKCYYELPILKRHAMLATPNVSPPPLRMPRRKVGFDGYRV